MFLKTGKPSSDQQIEGNLKMLKTNNHVSKLLSWKELPSAAQQQFNIHDDEKYLFRYFKYKGDYYDIDAFERTKFRRNPDYRKVGSMHIGQGTWLFIRPKGLGVVVCEHN